jgi:hypothetical protein
MAVLKERDELVDKLHDVTTELTEVKVALGTSGQSVCGILSCSSTVTTPICTFVVYFFVDLRVWYRV